MIATEHTQCYNLLALGELSSVTQVFPALDLPCNADLTPKPEKEWDKEETNSHLVKYLRIDVRLRWIFSV